QCVRLDGKIHAPSIRESAYRTRRSAHSTPWRFAVPRYSRRGFLKQAVMVGASAHLGAATQARASTPAGVHRTDARGQSTTLHWLEGDPPPELSGTTWG